MMHFPPSGLPSLTPPLLIIFELLIYKNSWYLFSILYGGNLKFSDEGFKDTETDTTLTLV